jgi:hypothetical protein
VRGGSTNPKRLFFNQSKEGVVSKFGYIPKAYIIYSHPQVYRHITERNINQALTASSPQTLVKACRERAFDSTCRT